MESIAGYIEWFSPYIGGFFDASVLAMEVSILAIVLSWFIGLAASLGKEARSRLVRWPAEFYIWFVRGTPSLIQIFIIYFGIPHILDVRISPFVAGVLALAVSSGAYVAEVFRSGFSAIPRGQMESALALGMTPWQMMQHIILPQVIRIVVPAMTNEAINTLKNTSLLSTITIVEVTMFAQLSLAETFRPFDFLIAAALIYLFMTTLLSQFAAWYERRFALVL